MGVIAQRLNEWTLPIMLFNVETTARPVLQKKWKKEASNMLETTALAVLNQYPPDKFNVLIPVKTLQEISPIHTVIINEVKINPDPAAKDVYKEGESGDLALTKISLSKMMAAANIQVIDSRPTPPQKCQRCIEAASKTKLAPRCGGCPSADDVAHQVTIAVPEPSGTYRIVKGTKELRMEDERAKMKTEAQFKRFFPYRTEHCETKALNRALREGLMIKSTYKPEELQKPFAIALVVPNFSDPDMKRAMVQRYASGIGDLFGGTQQGEAPAAGSFQTLPDGRTADISTGEVSGGVEHPGDQNEAGIVETQATIGDDELPWEKDEGLKCSDCQGEIKDEAGWTAKMYVDFSQNNYGRQLCTSCIKKVREARKRGA